MAVWTTNGLNIAAQSGVQNSITYIGIGTGAGVLATPLTAGSPTASLIVAVGIPAALSAGQQLVITDGVNVDTATVAAPGAAMGATTIPVSSYTPADNFAASTTAVAPAPLASDTTLYNEVARIAANPGVAGAGAGESLNSGYFDGTQPTNIYMQVGFFGGATASLSVNTGTLMIEDTQYWNHTINTDTNTYQADTTI